MIQETCYVAQKVQYYQPFSILCSPLGYALSYLESLTKYVPNNEVMKYKMRQIAKLKIVLSKHGAETRDPYLEV